MKPNENMKVDMEEFRGCYKRLLEASLDSMISIDQDGTIKDLNKATQDIIGIDRNKLIGTKFSECFTEPDKAEELYSQVLKNEKVFRCELKLKNVGGYSVPMIYNASIYEDNEGRVMGVFATGRDGTIFKNNQQEITYLKKRFEELIKEKSDELIIIHKELAFQSGEKLDTDAELVKVNKELEYENSEKDKRASELILANIELAFQSEEKEKRAAELIQANRNLVVQKETIKELNDELTLRVSQLESANVELEALSYSISHDLKAPVRHK